jgi:hypothetical protein
MKKYLLICVNYKSDEALQQFVESVHRAAMAVEGKMKVDIEVADNSENNLGYLGGAFPIYNSRARNYDFVSISNVDLELASDFFEQLLLIDTKDLGWIAPDIYTARIDRHENPYMLSRPTKRNFIVWDIIYSYTLFYRMYHALHLLKNKNSKVYPACKIYAGHGSFMLFTRAFIDQYPELHYPTFMYGEEIYMAELVRATQLKVRYIPTLRIANTGNISTGLVNQTQKSAWSKESLYAIKNQFFE